MQAPVITLVKAKEKEFEYGQAQSTARLQGILKFIIECNYLKF